MRYAKKWKEKWKIRELPTLLQSAKSGDEEAMMELVGVYMPMILRASRVNGMYDEDCFQDILCKVFQAIKNFPREFSPDATKLPR